METPTFWIFDTSPARQLPGMMNRPVADIFFAPASCLLAQEPSVEEPHPILDAFLDVLIPIEALGTGYRWSEGAAWNAAEGELVFPEISNNIIHVRKPNVMRPAVTELMRLKFFMIALESLQSCQALSEFCLH